MNLRIDNFAPNTFPHAQDENSLLFEIASFDGIGQNYFIYSIFLKGQKMINNLRSIALFSALIVGACTTTKEPEDDPGHDFNKAKAYYENGNYDLAVKKLSEFKSRYPYSRYAVEAGLLIANSYFEQSKFAEASVAYEQFENLHPNHEKMDFVLYRDGMSYWEDAPTAINREQEYTHLAIQKWERLQERFPSSSYSSEVSKYIKEGKIRIAESEDFIASFYCRKEIWHACAFHSYIILDRHPEHRKLVKKALRRASEALEHIANEKPYAEKKNLYNRNATKEELLQKAKDLKERYKKI